MPITRTSSEGLDASDRGARGVLAWGADALHHFRAATERGPGRPAGHVDAGGGTLQAMPNLVAAQILLGRRC